MTVVLREHGLRFITYVDDHEPAYVHVRGDGEAKIELGNAEFGPSLVYAKGLSNADIRRVMRTVIMHREAFVADWRRIHG